MEPAKQPEFARDMDLVRAILMWAEKGGWHADAPEADPVKLAYHVRIMTDGGLIDGRAELRRIFGPGQGWDADPAMVNGLTWKGHEFLDATRNDTIWAKTKETFVKSGAPLVAELLLSVAKSIIGQRTGLSMP